MARNPIISRATCDWVIFPDAHEILTPESRDVIKDFLNQRDKHAGIDLLSPYIHLDVDEHGIPYLIFPRPMIFRNNKGIIFKDAVHNYLDTTEDKKAVAPQIVLIHNMPESRKAARTDQRNEMNPAGLQSVLDDDPKDSRALFYLGNTYFDLKMYDEAIEKYNKLLEYHEHGMNIDWLSHVYISLTAGYIRTEKLDNARAYAYEAMKMRWDRSEPYCHLGHISYHQERYDEAAHWYRIATMIEPPVTAFFLLGEMYSIVPWEGLMLSLNAMGCLSEAVNAARKVLEYKPNDTQILRNIELMTEAIGSRAAQDIMSKAGLKVSVRQDKGFAFAKGGA